MLLCVQQSEAKDTGPQTFEPATVDSLANAVLPWLAPVTTWVDGVPQVLAAHRDQPAPSAGLCLVLIIAVFVNGFLHFCLPYVIMAVGPLLSLGLSLCSLSLPLL